MSAVEEYRAARHDINHGGFPPFSGEQMSRIRDAADAAIAEKDARVAALGAERDSWKILADLYKEACHEVEAMLRLACSTYVYDAGSKGFVLVNDPDVQIRELRDRVQAERNTP